MERVLGLINAHFTPTSVGPYGWFIEYIMWNLGGNQPKQIDPKQFFCADGLGLHEFWQIMDLNDLALINCGLDLDWALSLHMQGPWFCEQRPLTWSTVFRKFYLPKGTFENARNFLERRKKWWNLHLAESCFSFFSCTSKPNIFFLQLFVEGLKSWCFSCRSKCALTLMFRATWKFSLEHKKIKK